MRDRAHGKNATPGARHIPGNRKPRRRLGSPAESAQNHGAGWLALSWELEISGPGSVRSRRNGSSLDLEVVVCRNPGELDLAGWKHPVVDASGRGSVDLEACPPCNGAVIPNAHRVVASRTRA